MRWKGRPDDPAAKWLSETCKLNDIDPQAWLADVLARLPDHPTKRFSDLLPWNWRPPPWLAEVA
jgi:IS66 C-terminal element